MEQTRTIWAPLQTPRIRLTPVEDEVRLAQAFALISLPDIKAGLEFPRVFSALQFAGRLKANPALTCFLLIPHGSEWPIGLVVYWGNAPAVGCGQILYAIHPDHRGQGFALEATRALLNRLFQQGSIHGIGAFVAHGNAVSHHILMRLGMRAVGYGRTNMIFYYVGREGYRVEPLDRLTQSVDWSKSRSRLAQLAAMLYGLMITKMGM